MLKKLSDDDRRIVDLLVERPTAQSLGGTDSNPYASATGAVEQKRLGAVEKVFKLLDMMPEEPVPADLLAKTIKRLNSVSRPDRTGQTQSINLPADPSGPAV